MIKTIDVETNEEEFLVLELPTPIGINEAKDEAKDKKHGPLCKGECTLWPARFACVCNPGREFTTCNGLTNHSKNKHNGTVEPTTYVQEVPPTEQLALLEKRKQQLLCVPPLI